MSDPKEPTQEEVQAEAEGAEEQVANPVAVEDIDEAAELEEAEIGGEDLEDDEDLEEEPTDEEAEDDAEEDEEDPEEDPEAA